MTGEELWEVVMSKDINPASVTPWDMVTQKTKDKWARAAAKLQPAASQMPPMPPSMTAFEEHIINYATAGIQSAHAKIRSSQNLAICPTCKEEKSATHIAAYNQCAACTEAGR